MECLAAVVDGVVDDRDRDGLAGFSGLERQRSVCVLVVAERVRRSIYRQVLDGYGPAESRLLSVTTKSIVTSGPSVAVASLIEISTSGLVVPSTLICAELPVEV